MRHSKFSQRRASVVSVATALTSVVLSATSAHSAEPLEIKASLSGYNLIGPTTRCCAFDLVLRASGKVAVTIHDRRGDQPRDQRVDLILTMSQVNALLEVISGNKFFSLPASVGDMPIDDDVRRMEIQIGSRTHKVELNGWPVDQQTLDTYDAKKRSQIGQAAAVWIAIRKLVGASQVALP